MNRKNIILAGCCSVLLITWLVGLFTAPERQAQRRKETLLITSLQRDDIVALNVGSNSFHYTDDSWVVDSLPAREDRIMKLLDDLEAANNIGKVGANDASYGLTDDRVLGIVYSSGKETVLTLGDRVAGSKYIYATIDDESKVLQTDNTLDFYFRQNESYWRDLRLYPENTRPNEEEVIQVSLTTGEQSYTLSRNLSDGVAGWLVDAADPADTDLSNAFVRTFFNLEASDIVSVSSMDVGDMAFEVKAQVQNGATFVTIVYSSNDPDLFYAQPTGIRKDYYFMLKAAVKDRLQRDRTYFLREAPSNEAAQ